MLTKILIANRGEIAVRIERACRELGIISAAIYSDADEGALHVRLADEAYRIGPPPASESYLETKKIIKLARKIGAQAVHPGYGFLSENADFIRELEKAGIIFIGPSAKSVELMGEKTAARRLMKSHNVPIVPGTVDPIKSVDEGLKIASEIGYPVMIKASAGGGGKGMRKVDSEAEFAGSFEKAGSEALKAFGDSSVYIEKFVDEPKHIEVQIIGDTQGNYAHLFERECSIQRRHQKIIEESPSPAVDEQLREKITSAAVDAAKACQYYNAGTVEFLYNTSTGDFYFLEMNTRLQVEHPVTEMITGVDLVKEQISIASGNPLSFRQSDIKKKGHAVECRVYAEDTDNNFAPSIGKAEYHRLPSGPGLRIDGGIAQYSDIPIYYDPLLSKVIAWGTNREEAIVRLIEALSSYHIAGLKTNIDFLKWILSNNKFRDGSFNINFIEDEFLPLLPEGWKNYNDEKVFAAALFSAVMKDSECSLKTGGIVTSKNNEWRTQIYE